MAWSGSTTLFGETAVPGYAPLAAFVVGDTVLSPWIHSQPAGG